MRKNICVVIASAFLFVCAPLLALSSLPANLVSINSSQGSAYLLASKNKDIFIPLLSQFVTQINQAYCGVASSVMILNALQIPAPVDKAYAPYPYFTQDNFFTPNMTVSPDFVAHHGMTLDQLANALSQFPIKVTIIYGNDVSLAQFRQTMLATMAKPNAMIIVNFLRSTLHQEGHGHFSPVAAYNAESDSFLILDVARYRYPAFWVKTQEMWQAIRTIDPESKKSRGLVVIDAR